MTVTFIAYHVREFQIQFTEILLRIRDIPYIIYGISYTSKWPKTAVTEMGSRDLTCKLQNGPNVFSLPFLANLKLECMSSHVALSLSQQFWAILRYMIYGISRTINEI